MGCIFSIVQVVLDTSVVVSAFRSRSGASNAVMRRVAAGIVVPLATPALFLEYEDVLKRPAQRAVSGLSLADVDLVLAALASATLAVETHFMWRPQLRDANDEMVLEAAVNGRAAAIVTHNERDFMAAAPRFGLEVLTPRRLLQRIER